MKSGIRIIIGLATISLGAVHGHAQQIGVPLHYGMKNGILDEYGQVLPGSAASPGALVQILSEGAGVMPPDVSGAPHTNNTVLGTSRIGQGIDPDAGEIGKSSGSVLINRAVAAGMFARIFNKPTPEESSFYTDSAVYTNSTTTYGIFKIDASQTSTPLDPGDDDTDGLNNSWEKSVGSDRNNPDTDGDGMRDGPEFRAGTGITNENSNLALVTLVPNGSGNLGVQWDAVPGKSYQLQFTAFDLTSAGNTFSNVNEVVTASSSNAATVVTNGMNYPVGHFRVLLVE